MIHLLVIGAISLVVFGAVIRLAFSNVSDTMKLIVLFALVIVLGLMLIRLGIIQTS